MKIGFIGTGNMASAIVDGLLSTAYAKASDIYGYNPSEDEISNWIKKYKVNKAESHKDLCNNCDIIILAVKPQMFSLVLYELNNNLNKNNKIISIAAGINIEALETMLNHDIEIIRVMPNVNAIVHESCTEIVANKKASKEFIDYTIGLFSSFGKTSIIEEKYFSIASAIAGCSTGFTCMYIDALARAGLKNGLSKKEALTLAAQTTLGTAKLILESGKHPFELLDMITSPAGTTIAGVTYLEQKAFMGIVMDAVEASYYQDIELLKNK